MKKDFLIYFIQNTSFFPVNQTDKDYIINTSNAWFKYAYPHSDIKRAVIKPIKALKIPFSNITHITKAQNYYSSNESEFNNQVFVFNSILDINPSMKKAFKYLWSLDKIGYTVFLLSVNPKSPIRSYIRSYMRYYGIYDPYLLISEKTRSEKYKPEILDFAAGLRACNPPVKYKKISEITGIPKSTIISYMKRNGMFCNDNKTGIDKISKSDLSKLQEILDNGGVTICIN